MSAPYSGTWLIESLESAVNYNSHIADLVAKYAHSGPMLDFGAGNGTIARILKKRGRTIECLEPDIDFRLRLKNEGFKTHDSLSSLSNSFDTVYSINVLEHIEDDQHAIQSLRQVLKPKGKVIIYVPAFMLLYSSVDKNIGHHRRYTAEGLAKLFAGFTVLRCEYADSLGFFAGLAFKTFDSGKGHVSEKSIRLYDQYAFPISKLLDVGLRHLLGKNVLLVAEKQ